MLVEVNLRVVCCETASEGNGQIPATVLRKVLDLPFAPYPGLFIYFGAREPLSRAEAAHLRRLAKTVTTYGFCAIERLTYDLIQRLLIADSSAEFQTRDQCRAAVEYYKLYYQLRE